MGAEITLNGTILATNSLQDKDNQNMTLRSPEKMVRILMVEDSPEDSLYLTDLLEEACEHSCSLVIDAAINYADAEGLLRQNNYDLVILDYMLGFKTGLELLQRIKSKNSSIPVIFMTGQGSEKIAAEAMKSGADDYIIKDDLDTCLIKKIVNRYLFKRSSHKLVNATKTFFAKQIDHDQLDWNFFQSVDNSFKLTPKQLFLHAKAFTNKGLSFKFFMNLDKLFLLIKE